MTIEQALQLAVQHQQAGRFREADAVYRQILAAQPNHPFAWYQLGAIAHQTGQRDSAIELLTRATSAKPDWPEAFYHLAIVYQEQGNTNAAITNYERAIAVKPAYAEAYNNMGIALKTGQRADEAVAAFRQAIMLRYNYPEAHNNLAGVLNGLGRADEAIISCNDAIGLRPNYAEAFSNLGSALRAAGKLDQAADACRQAISLKPDFPEAHNNLGTALKGVGNLDEAVVAFQHAVRLRPGYADAYRNLGNTLKAKGQLDGAIAAYRRAIGLRPKYVEAHSSLIYAMLYHPACDSRAICEECARWNYQHAEPQQSQLQPHNNDRNPDRRLRVGYVSPHFYAHPAGRLLIPLFTHHDKTQIELFAYSQVNSPDSITAQLQSSCDGWREIRGLTDEQLANQIRDDRIDILIDLTMHMGHNRLLVFARKPAPVQVTWLGYPGTTGLTAIDYRLTDPYLDPPGTDESLYSERTVRLPDSYWCYDPLDAEEILVGPPPSAARGFITFGCLNNFCKVTDAGLAMWARVLAEIPDSRIIILSPPGDHRQNIIHRLAVAPDRVEFVDRMSREDYLATYQRIDIALDTFPYNGHTTSLDAMWMGVPVVTMIGDTIVGRAGWSQVSNLGLQSLAGKTVEEFQHIAVGLARDLPRLIELRAGLRERMRSSPLMGATKFAKHFEAACRQMWRDWCQGSGSLGNQT